MSGKSIRIGKLSVGGGKPLVLIAGPCVIEGREMILSTARTIVKLGKKYRVGVIFKSSFKKANRTSAKSFTGIDRDRALQILDQVRSEFDVPVVTDVHTEADVHDAAGVADVLQIPAFLCRQTDLLQAAGRTGKTVNIKKGQFLSPSEMKHSAEKVAIVGNKRIMLTERGTTFGYNNLVVDMRSLVVMRESGYPIVLDATHAVQIPGGEANTTGGRPEFIFPLARAGAAVGIDALFVETHPDPRRAMSDASSQLKLDLLESLLKQVLPIDAFAKERRDRTA